MKRFMILAVCLILVTWACQKEDEKVTPTTDKMSQLTAAEQDAANKLGALIPISRFEEMKSRFQSEIGPDDVRAVSYGRTVLEKVLAQKGCVGIRFYFAKEKDGKQTLVFIGVDKDGRDIKSSANAKAEGEASQTGGDGPCCPRNC